MVRPILKQRTFQVQSGHRADQRVHLEANGETSSAGEDVPHHQSHRRRARDVIPDSDTDR